MSTRVVVPIAMLVVAVLALGYYLGREEPAPAPPAPVPEVKPASEMKRAPEEKLEHAPIEPSRATDVDQRPISIGQILARVGEPRDPVLKIAVIGGERIPLQFQVVRRSRGFATEADDGKSGGFFQPLADAARTGDDGAARALYEWLGACKSWPKTRAEFEAGQAERAKRYAVTGGVVMPGQPPSNFDQDNKAFEWAFHRCEGVTADMYPTAMELLRESAERGVSDDSRAAYAQAIVNTDPNEARAQYEILWQHGSIDALQRLARDSLPHAIAYAAVLSVFSSDGTGEGPNRMRAAELSVNPSTFAQASEEAVRMLKNPSCCKF